MDLIWIRIHNTAPLAPDPNYFTQNCNKENPFYLIYLAGKMVDFVCVLPLGELAVQEGHVLVGLVLEHLHPLPATRLVLARHCHRIQLSNLQQYLSR